MSQAAEISKRGILKRPLRSSASASKKTVSFQGFVKSFKILHINDYSQRQIRNTWYNADDYARIKKNMLICLAKQDDRFFCSRGLENLSPTGHERRHQVRQEAREAVLNVQGMMDGMLDHEKVATVYASLSAECQRLACLRGSVDEHAIVDKETTISKITDLQTTPCTTKPLPSQVATHAA
jgi:hypothetical protein